MALGGPFTLTDQDGRTRTDRDFAGRYRIMYFGYTFCPDVCPTDMQTVGAGLRLFEAKDPVRGAKVVPIFVTVDPKRDTPAVLKAFSDEEAATAAVAAARAAAAGLPLTDALALSAVETVLEEHDLLWFAPEELDQLP